MWTSSVCSADSPSRVLVCLDVDLVGLLRAKEKNQEDPDTKMRRKKTHQTKQRKQKASGCGPSVDGPLLKERKKIRKAKLRQRKQKRSGCGSSVEGLLLKGSKEDNGLSLARKIPRRNRGSTLRYRKEPNTKSTREECGLRQAASSKPDMRKAATKCLL